MPVNIWEGSDASAVAAALEVIAQNTGGRISSYNDLSDKPQIGGVELSGNKSLANLGIAASADVHSIPSGGTTGQVLKKSSGTNYAVEWGDAGSGNASIDDTAGHGDTNVVWSAGKTYDTTSSLREAITNLESDFAERTSENIFDKTTITANKYFNINFYGTYIGISSDNSMNIAYVPFDEAGDYSAKVATTFFGENAKYIPLFDESFENTTVVTGTVTNGICVFTISAEHITNGAKYIGLSIIDGDLNTAMVVKSDEYPSEYIPYAKQTVFNGGVNAENVIGLNAKIGELLQPFDDTIEAFDHIAENFHDDVGENLFDKSSVTANKYFNIAWGGTYNGIATDNSLNIAFVPIVGTGIYSARVATEFYGVDIAKYIPLFNISFENVAVVEGTVTNKIDVFSITAEHISNGAKYIGLSVRDDDLNTAMVVNSATYPETYIPYYNNGLIFTGSVNREKVNDLLITKAKSANLFNNNDVIHGKYFNVNGSGVYSGLSDSGTTFISYVKLDGAGDYSLKNARQNYGAYAVKYVVLFNASKEYVSVVTGSVDNSDNTITHFSISASDINDGAYYIGYTVYTTDLGMAMIVKSSTYPAEYIPYYTEHVELKNDIALPVASAMNPLFGKTVVFDGDSICQDGQCGGYAKIIGNGNGMVWKNAGIAGGTITAGTTAGGNNRHWVSRSIDDIHDEFDDLDYLILEGGTNDADTLTDADIGTIDPTNFSTFDDETFVGALESLFYKATGYYPTAKIGFVIPHRMGYASGARYDSADSPSTRRRRKFFETAINVCKKWGIPYIDLWEGSPLCPMLECYYDSTTTATENTEAGKAYTDGQHLTAVGYSIIAPKIEAWMKTL